MNNLNDLHKISSTFSNTEKMPVLFLGHGSSMIAIEENQFVDGFRNMAKTLPQSQNESFLYFLKLVIKSINHNYSIIKLNILKLKVKI